MLIWQSCLFCLAANCLLSGTAFGLAESTVPASDEVRVRIEVTISASEEGEATNLAGVFAAGNLNALGRWRPDGLKLDRLIDGKYVAEFLAPSGTQVEFKITKGTWQTVEKNHNGEDISNRKFEVVASKDNLPQLVSVSVERWGKPRPVVSTVTGNVVLHEQFASTYLTHTRNITVWLPQGYEQSEDRYPVLYLHDGQNLFDDATAAFGVEWQVDETTTRLIEASEIPPIIIVGIWNTANRIDEYTMTKDSQFGRGGKGAEYLQFLTNELKPFIDKTYRTRTDQPSTSVGGSSLGGLISMHLCRQRPDVFGNCLAFSPSLGWDQEELLNAFESGSGWPENVQLWISTGAQEGPDHDAHKSNLARARQASTALTRTRAQKARQIHFEEFNDGSHDERSWARQFPSAMKALFAPVPE